jgi:hypothetical protein
MTESGDVMADDVFVELVVPPLPVAGEVVRLIMVDGAIVVGWRVGCFVRLMGRLVGTREGRTVGVGVGGEEGSTVGSLDGWAVVGASVGKSEDGAKDGSEVGGSEVGAAVSLMEGSGLGATVYTKTDLKSTYEMLESVLCIWMRHSSDSIT